MNEALQNLANQPYTTIMGWTLLHFVWQATLLALFVGSLLSVMARASARLRYAVSCAGLSFMVVVPVATFLYLGSRESRQSPAPSLIADGGKQANDLMASSPAISESPVDLEDPQIFGGRELRAGEAVVMVAPRNRAESQPTTYTLESAVARLDGSLPWLVTVWCAGVCFFTLRLSVGLGRIGRWRREAQSVMSGELAAVLKRMMEQMGLRRQVLLLKSARSTAPAVVGWVKPAILVPMSMLSSLTTAELEAILAHELAHVQRHDYLINLLQTLVETLLFYHPAVWWLSNRIRLEREHCCDDIAVTLCGNRAVFAQALARLEERRCALEQLAIAAKGGSVVQRIRRLLANTPTQSTAGWPSLIVLTSVGVLVCGLWISAVTATPNDDASSSPVASADEEPAQTDSDDYATHRAEVEKLDSKTGTNKRVFSEIKLWRTAKGKPQQATLDMMYSNVMSYTFIPQRIARALNATELGAIDFGAEPPPRPRPFQSMRQAVPDRNNQGDRKPDESGEKPNLVTVNQLIEPLKDGKVVPYPNDRIWVPGHLGFYGMNPTKQHVFKIVRLDKVDLGVGPTFGPVNALVLADENSDFGVLGRNWAQQPRGPRGESLWFSADGAFHFMAAPKPAPRNPPPLPRPRPPGALKVTSSGQPAVDRLDRPGVKVLATHTYDLKHRQSTDVVRLRRGNVPVDDGVRYENTVVYVTLFYDVVAVDRETKNVKWDIPWGKTKPTWQTVSIVELSEGNERRKAVELFAANTHLKELVYRYVSLESGKEIEFSPKAAAPPDPNNDGTPDVQVVEESNGRITRAVIKSTEKGRSAVELVQHFAAMRDQLGLPQLKGNITNMETLVSAKPRYLLGAALDADEVTFNVPEGSGIRAELSGEKLEIEPLANGVRVIVTGGQVELLDAGGVNRATASPDGGAEQLVVECQNQRGEVVLSLSTRRIKPDENYPRPPVQVKMNLRTGAAKDETDPPHGAVRYSILPEDKRDNKPARMKMQWHYNLERLTKEAEAKSGKSADELWNQAAPQPEADADATTADQLLKSVGELGNWLDHSQVGLQFADLGIVDNQRDDDAGDGWGPKPAEGNLRLRLTMLDDKLQAGRPIRLKLEIKNFGHQPQQVDPQYYAAFRVLKVTKENSEPDLFIGMTPQTSGGPVAVAPGMTMMLWHEVDAGELYMLDAGHYELQVRAPRRGGDHLPESQIIKTVIQQGAQPPLKRLLKQISSGLPKGWTVSNGFGAVYVSHSPTNLKRDVTTVQIWFTDDPLPKDFKLGRGNRTQEVAYLGKRQMGHMNVAALPEARRLWPDYVDFLRAAADKVESKQESPRQNQSDH